MLFKYFLTPIALAIAAVAHEESTAHPDIDFNFLTWKFNNLKESIVSFTQRESIRETVNGWNEVYQPIADIANKFSHEESHDRNLLDAQGQIFLRFLKSFEEVLGVTEQHPRVHSELYRIINELNNKFAVIVNGFRRHGVNLHSFPILQYLNRNLWVQIGFGFIRAL